MPRSAWSRWVAKAPSFFCFFFFFAFLKYFAFSQHPRRVQCLKSTKHCALITVLRITDFLLHDRIIHPWKCIPQFGVHPVRKTFFSLNNLVQLPSTFANPLGDSHLVAEPTYSFVISAYFILPNFFILLYSSVWWWSRGKLLQAPKSCKSIKAVLCSVLF